MNSVRLGKKVAFLHHLLQTRLLICPDDVEVEGSRIIFATLKAKEAKVQLGPDAYE